MSARRRTEELLANLHWTWRPGVRQLLSDIDPKAWAEADGVVADFLQAVPDTRWAMLEDDPGFGQTLSEMLFEQQHYLHETATWWATHHDAAVEGGIAYLSMEFGVHEGLPLYSGGLGVLAGDHLKSASDLGLPFVGIGLRYSDGYFEQVLTAAGQTERYETRSAVRLGLTRVCTPDGTPVQVLVPMGPCVCSCAVWSVQVGRTTLYLLDTDLPDNPPEVRALCSRLYAGDSTVRIRQELVLGLGGIRLLGLLGQDPGVVHLNEGHTGFAILQLVADGMAEGLSFDTAWSRTTSRVVFTTHTPVPAGHDRFSDSLVAGELSSVREELGLSHEALMNLGRVEAGSDESFCMTVLALRGSRVTNGVSKKHGEVSRDMWQGLWPGQPTPIGSITNGVHCPTWLGPQMANLLDERLGPKWWSFLVDGRGLDRLDQLDDTSLWACHQLQKQALLERIAMKTGHRLDPRALLVGFARRFATYKRGALLLEVLPDIDRLLTDTERPICFVFAGKAHPRDDDGKAVLSRLLAAASEPSLQGKLLVLEGYDMAWGRALTQGVDVWLNTPRPPLEASGTSGQKVGMNGGLNLSVLDGWWLEGHAACSDAGWAIGELNTTMSDEQRDQEDARALQRLLVQEVAPAYYERNDDGLPAAWLMRMRAAMRLCLERFNTDRMVRDYVEEVYLKR